MDIQTVIDRLRRFEPCSDYMYQMASGDVAIGAGHEIPNLAAAQQIPWHGSPTSIAIAMDYDRVRSAPRGLHAESYSVLTTVRLDAETVERLMMEDVQRCQTWLVKVVPELESYPEPAQQGLFDLAYDVGITGMMKYKKLLAACRAADWETAAIESRRHRRGIRDAEIEALFGNGATGSKAHTSPE